MSQAGVDLSGAACEVAGAGVQLVEPVAHDYEAVLQLGHAGVQLGDAALQALGAVQQSGRARLQLLTAGVEGARAAVEPAGRVDELTHLVFYPVGVDVDVEVEVYAVDAHGWQGEVLRRRGDQRVYALAGQERVRQLPVCAHGGDRGIGRGDVAEYVAGQREAGLERVVVVERAGALLVLRNGEAYLRLAALAGYLLRRDGLAVKPVGQRDVPGQLDLFQPALVVDALGVGCYVNYAALVLDLVAGVEHADAVVVAVVGYLPAGEAVDRVGADQLARGVERDVDDLLLLGGLAVSGGGGLAGGGGRLRGRGVCRRASARGEGGDGRAQNEQRGEKDCGCAFTGFHEP